MELLKLGAITKKIIWGGERLGSDKFPRIRIGVGEKPSKDYDLAAWVTGKFSAEDKKAVSGRFADVEKAIPLVLAGDMDKAMCLYNG